MTDNNEISNDRAVKSTSADIVLDLKGLNCPLPILRTKLALAKMKPGQTLHATTTDPMSVIDYRVFCERTGHHLLETTQGRDVFEFMIRCVADARDDIPGSAK